MCRRGRHGSKSKVIFEIHNFVQQHVQSEDQDSKAECSNMQSHLQSLRLWLWKMARLLRTHRGRRVHDLMSAFKHMWIGKEHGRR